MRHHTRILATLVACGAYCAAGPACSQTNGTWTNTSSGFQGWSTAGNWSGGSIADGIGATANFTANIAGAQTVQVNSGRTVGHINIGDPNNSHNYAFSGDVTLNVTSGNATFDVNTAGQRVVVDRIKSVAAVGGAGADTLEKKGPGTLFIQFDPGQTQKWAISEGAVELSGGDRLGANPGSFAADAVTLNGGTIQPNTTSGTVNLSLGNQGFTLGAAGGTFKADGTATLVLAANPTPALITGAGGLTKTGTGVLQIQADNNDYAGDTLVSEGELKLASTSNVLPNGAGKGNVTVSAGATLNLNDRSDTINGLNGGGTVKSTSGTQTLTLGDGNADGSFSGALQNTAGTLNLIKTGSGAQIMALGSSLTYGGATTVNGGTVVVNGTKSGLGVVTVNNSSTLGGAGSIAGALTFNNTSTLAPGASAGTLTLGGALVLNSDTISAFELNGSDTTPGSEVNDLVTVGGNLTLGGTLNVASAGGDFATAPQTSQWRLFTYSGTLTNNGFNVGTMPALMDPSWGYAIDTSTTGQVNLVITVVPEAPAWAFAGLACTALGAVYGARSRRRPSAASSQAAAN